MEGARDATMKDPYDLQRFVDAQAPAYAQVLTELRAGRKRTHWMWFIFPQISGLGSSPMAIRYAVSGRDEASAYLRHALLGPRLHECTQLVTAAPETLIGRILPSPDDLKFRSSMTLFANATADNKDFLAALEKYYGGVFDPLTMAKL
jgi:uncharacterized protein (DUF1810 family)